MAKLTAIDSEYINDKLTWFSERSDSEGVRLQEETRCDSLPGQPLVLFAFRDFKLVKPEGDARHVKNTCPRIYHEFEKTVGSLGLRSSNNSCSASLIEFCKQIRDDSLDKLLRKSGGVFTVLGDSHRAFVVLLWVGKTSKEVRKSLDDLQKSAQRDLATQTLQEALKEAVEILGSEHVRSVVDNFVT